MNFEKVLQMIFNGSVFTRTCKEWEEKQAMIAYNMFSKEIEYDYTDKDDITYNTYWKPIQEDILANDWTEL